MLLLSLLFCSYSKNKSRGGADEGAQARRLLSELLLQLTYNKEYLVENSNDKYSTDDDDDNDDVIKETDQNIKKRKIIIGNINEVKQNDEFIKTTHVHDISSINEGRGLVVIAATNRLEDLDEAIVRRFESKVLVNVPDLDDRLALVSNYMKDVETNLSENERNNIGEMTFGWSGSEIEALCRDASFGPIRDVMPILSTRTINGTSPNSIVIRSVTNDDFLNSYNILMGNNNQVDQIA